jgi:LPXTG-motif cell wall-anchored protein
MTRVRAAAAVAAAILTVAVAAGDAGAHSEQGLLAVTAEAAADARVVSVVATLKYANDGDVVSNAVVTTSATNAAGESTAPTTLLAEGAGRYRGELLLPSDGTWDVTVRSEEPVASAGASVTVPAEPPPSTTAAPSSTLVLRPVDTATNDDDSGSGLLVGGGVVVAVVLVAGGGYLLVRRRRAVGS